MQFLNNPLFDEATPAETPPATGGSEPAPASAGSDVDWAEESRPDHIEPEAKPTAAPATPAPATPVATPPATPAAQPAATTPPATPPQAQPPVPPAAAPAATPPQAAPAQPAATTEPTAQPQPPVDRTALRKNEIDRLTREVYAINPEVAQEVLTQPETALPKILANAHVAIIDSLVPAIMHAMPGVIHQVMQAGNQHREAEDAFFKAWPVLREDKYKDTVTNAIKMYRHLNPTAPREEAIRASGISAMISLRLPIPPEMLSPAAPAVTPPPTASFAPVAPGATHVPAPVAPQNSNPFELLNQELDESDGIVRH